jgi:hypothetical protein
MEGAEEMIQKFVKMTESMFTSCLLVTKKYGSGKIHAKFYIFLYKKVRFYSFKHIYNYHPSLARLDHNANVLPSK